MALICHRTLAGGHCRGSIGNSQRGIDIAFRVSSWKPFSSKRFSWIALYSAASHVLLASDPNAFPSSLILVALFFLLFLLLFMNKTDEEFAASGSNWDDMSIRHAFIRKVKSGWERPGLAVWWATAVSVLRKHAVLWAQRFQHSCSPALNEIITDTLLLFQSHVNLALSDACFKWSAFIYEGFYFPLYSLWHKPTWREAWKLGSFIRWYCIGEKQESPAVTQILWVFFF